MDLQELPVLGICGASGSGKTTLIEHIVRHLQGQGLRVAVAKHSPKALTIDQPGKDSDRFFEAGADLLMMGRGGVLVRKHPSSGSDFGAELLTLATLYDVVLVEGYQSTPGPKVWLLGDDESPPPADDKIIAILARNQARQQAMMAVIDEFVARQWPRPPVLGCILIGGQSSRMGQAKHLLLKEGKTWLERTAATLGAVCQQVVVAGQGDMGECHVPRLPDVPGCSGPLAGILAVMRWQPWASVLVCACDLPDVSVEALDWLLQQRAPGARALMPKVGDYHEPLLALYDYRIRPALETMARRDIRRMSVVADFDGVRVLSPPAALHGAWRNVNYPGQI